MAERNFNFDEYVDTAMSVVIGIIGIALAGGIGTYILVQFASNTDNETLAPWVNLLTGNVNMVSTVITILLVAIIAVVGIGLIKLLRGATKRGE